MHCPRAPTPEPSTNKGHRPKNRQSQNRKVNLFLPTAGISFLLLSEGCRVGPAWSTSPCFACWSLWLACPDAVSLLTPVGRPHFLRAFFSVTSDTDRGHRPKNRLFRYPFIYVASCLLRLCVRPSFLHCGLARFHVGGRYQYSM